MDLILIIQFVTYLTIAIVCGGLIGWERERKAKPAGLKTNILICVGSMIFTFISVLLSQHGDITRILAQIVSGIGFIGAGAVFKISTDKNEDKVMGLTTAAIVWVNAAIGILVGLGFAALALISALSVVGLSKLVDIIDNRS